MLLVFFFFSALPLTCPDGFDEYYDHYSCIRALNGRMTFPEARRLCDDLNSDIVEIDSASMVADMNTVATANR